MSARNCRNKGETTKTRRTRVFVVSLFVAVTVHRQTPQPASEVASIKRNVSLSANSSQRNMPGGRINFSNQRLRQVIRAAFGGSDIEAVGGPDWVDNDRWDILATPAT